MHMKHIAFLVWPVFLVAPEWHHGKASSWSERLFPSFPLRLLTQLSASLLRGRPPFFEDCRVEEAGNFTLTARQSMVKVDVAQVFWRPFWQTHFVVVVDHPPAEDKHLRKRQIILVLCEILGRWGCRKCVNWRNYFFFFVKLYNSPSLLFNVTDVMSRHCGCSHVADESK